MKINVRNCILIAVISNIFGCADLDTHLAISEKPLPASFNTPSSKSSTSIANINWRQYFTDPLLIKLIDTAVKDNIDLQTALQRIQIARSSVKLANAKMLPDVKLNVGSSIRKFGLYTMDGAGNISTEITPGQIVPIDLPDYYLGIQTSWEVDVWGRLRNQRQSAVAQYLSSIEGTHFVISNLVADIAISYQELLAFDNELDIIRQTIQKQQEALEVIRLQKENGRANELAVQQFKAQLLNTKVLEKKAEQQVTETENKINFLLGRFPQTIERDNAVLYQPVVSQIQTGFPSQMLNNRPDIREAEYQIQASQFDLKAAKSAFFPNFTITANVGFQAFNPEFLFNSPASIAYSFMGNLVAPIINMNAIEAYFNTAKANQLTAMYNYQKTILNAFVEVSNELSNIKNLEHTNTLKKEQSDVLKLSVDTANELYKSARATYLEVLIAQQSALQTNLELINVIKNQRISMVNVYKALGGGWK